MLVVFVEAVFLGQCRLRGTHAIRWISSDFGYPDVGGRKKESTYGIGHCAAYPERQHVNLQFQAQTIDDGRPITNR